MGEITHTSTLPDRAISQSDTEKLDSAVGAGPGVVATMAAMRASPGHGGVPKRIERGKEGTVLLGSESQVPTHGNF